VLTLFQTDRRVVPTPFAHTWPTLRPVPARRLVLPSLRSTVQTWAPRGAFIRHEELGGNWG
jgi:hypothetical protein